MERVKKARLDAQVATLLGKKRSEVSGVTAAFLQEVVRGLAEKGTVHLEGLGTLHVNGKRGHNVYHYMSKTGKRGASLVTVKYHVSFKKAQRLRRAIQDSLGKSSQGVSHGEVRSRRDRRR